MNLDPLPVDALAVGAHPDDIELVVGGTLLKLHSLGYKTAVLDMTCGEMGTRGSAEIRAQEALAAAKVLKLTARENLGLPDSKVWCDEGSRTKMVRALRRFRPKVVFTHYWDDPHPDHAHIAQIVREAAYLSGLAKYDVESGQARYRPSAIAHFMFPRTVIPTFVVDISEFVQDKMAAIHCYKSQLYDPNSQELETNISNSGFLGRVDARQRFYGGLISVENGEAFVVKEALNIADPIALLTRDMNMYS
ncbi:MAG: bacillithiol biosynthesis deacetylase BshB1 [Acidobacteria bacterium]|nr:bacillithiol biosynthesis deacetylase BshB1 [Acidobacteriota bacterium]